MYDTTVHRDYTSPKSVPRITENGDTSGGDDVASRVNIWAGSPGFGLTSGSLNASITQNDPHKRTTYSTRTRASAAYVTGSHNAKVGYEGGYFTNSQTNTFNEPQMAYTYNKPATSCLTSTNPLACGHWELVSRMAAGGSAWSASTKARRTGSPASRSENHWMCGVACRIAARATAMKAPLSESST